MSKELAVLIVEFLVILLLYLILPSIPFIGPALTRQITQALAALVLFSWLIFFVWAYIHDKD